MPPIHTSGCVYMITNQPGGVLYTGVTSELPGRMWKHREAYYRKSFSAAYNCKRLVYYRYFETIGAAIAEEKRIKGGSRAQKIVLIEGINREWDDLWERIQDH